MLMSTLKVFFAYTHATSAWLALQAVGLLIAPKLIIAMLTGEIHQTTGEIPGAVDLVCCSHVE